MLSLDKQNELRDRYRAICPGWMPATELYAAMVRHHLGPDSWLLDLGCGRGGLVEQLDHPHKYVVGVDPDLDSLRQHRLAGDPSPMPRTAAVSRHLPFADRTFDLVFASWVLEHMAQPVEEFREIGRVLRPEGRFIFITPNRRHPLSALNHLFGRMAGLQERLVDRLYGRVSGDTFPAHYRANTATTLARLAQAAGMVVEEVMTVPDPTYLAFTPTLFLLAVRLEAILPANRHIHLVGRMRRIGD